LGFGVLFFGFFVWVLGFGFFFGFFFGVLGVCGFGWGGGGGGGGVLRFWG